MPARICVQVAKVKHMVDAQLKLCALHCNEEKKVRKPCVCELLCWQRHTEKSGKWKKDGINGDHSSERWEKILMIFYDVKRDMSRFSCYTVLQPSKHKQKSSVVFALAFVFFTVKMMRNFGANVPFSFKCQSLTALCKYTLAIVQVHGYHYAYLSHFYASCSVSMRKIVLLPNKWRFSPHYDFKIDCFPFLFLCVCSFGCCLLRNLSCRRNSAFFGRKCAWKQYRLSSSERCKIILPLVKGLTRWFRYEIASVITVIMSRY